MFGIPEWALGVGVIIIAGGIASSLVSVIAPNRSKERLRGRRASRQALAQAIDDIGGKVEATEELQRRLDELDDVQRRLAEAEERLDFVERLLTKQREMERLGAEKK